MVKARNILRSELWQSWKDESTS